MLVKPCHHSKCEINSRVQTKRKTRYDTKVDGQINVMLKEKKHSQEMTLENTNRHEQYARQAKIKFKQTYKYHAKFRYF